MNADIRAEFDQLLGDLMDGAPDAAENARLNELLKAEPQLQNEYLDLVQLHALLQWRSGQAGPQGGDVLPLRPAVSLPARRPRWRRALAAAVLLLAAGLGLFFFLGTHESQAAGDVVERLVDWNLDLTQAHTPEERARIYRDHAGAIERTLAKASLPAEDRTLAKALFDNGAWLAANDDPMAEADRFDGLAEQLVARLDAAAAKDDLPGAAKLADSYSRLAAVGVHGNLKKAQANGALDKASKFKLDRALARDAGRTAKLQEIIERQPEPSRKVFRRAMKPHMHKGKK